MSMPKIEKQENSIDREQSVSNLIESVALMESGLSHIINAEGEKIQKAVNAESETSIDDMLKINNSVEKMVSSISKLEMILQNKLDSSNDLDKTNNNNPDNGTIIPYVGLGILTTMDDGNPEFGRIISFSDGNEFYEFSKVPLNGNLDQFDLNVSPTAFMMPRDGILTSFSAFYEVAGLGISAETEVVARLYSADTNSTTYYPIDNTIIHLTPVLPPRSEFMRISGFINNLNIALPVNSKIALLFYAISTQRIDLRGNAGGGLNIK